MWNGKNKAFTLSYDDGVEQDIKFVEIINRYDLKCTFNLNSGIMTPESHWLCGLNDIRRMLPEGLPELYKGHEIAVHCRTHANLTELDDEEVKRELLDDKAALENLFVCKINGMAYPYGAYDDRVLGIVSDCGFAFARTVADTHNFEVPKNLLKFGATCHHDYTDAERLLEQFISYGGEEPAIFCIWGHSYEFETNGNWDKLENICEKIAGRDDIFYGTNSQVFLEAQRIRQSEVNSRD